MCLSQLKEPVENEHNVAAIRRGGACYVYVLIDNYVCLLLETCVYVVCCLKCVYMLYVACWLHIKYFC